MSNKKLLVLFGATGNQGGSTAHFVLDDPTLAKQYAVRAITRDINNSKAQELQKKGAELVAADLDEPSTLPAALRGAHSVFLLTNTQYGGNSREIETRQAKAALGEALKQGVEYVIWSSMSHPYKISGGNLAQVEHFDDKAEIEEYIRGLPIKSAFYAPGSFMQNSSTHMKPRPSPANDGTHILGNLCSSATRIPLIDITDSGKWIGAILAEPDKYEGKFFAAAERLYSFEEIAQVMSKVSGKTVIHQQFPDEVFKSFVPESPLKEALCEMWLFIRDYGYYGTNMERDVEWASQQAKGRLTSLEEYLTKSGWTL
ncbi:NAD(P)-binding protein [Amniculicola lignicola CBS 123094]|uniref:NAD(P)-binding protein n=1 Tax=Amniculicola lignicola CBS 123094 TaxID=1392246 RepID=A0A6A5WWZ5_9PLEO|nr:NAD(P)-binding protein [Amniculicola lignicola CBS 123094]